ncbi:MAG TPA: hypothetical protein PLG33_09320 [Prolixibacteraceae bacterium]|jgi:hypothetical protein|nr:hypothetical protein [Prolixibacteraceae bacterium]
MKTVLKATFALALALVASNLFAVGNLKLNIRPINNEKAFVSISSLSDSNLNITITDDWGNIVYYQESEGKEGTYKQIFNFSELENGTYNMKVVSDDIATERQIQKTNDSIAIGAEKTTLKPFFGVEGNILRCSYLNFSNANTELHFYGNGQELYTKKIGNNFSVQEALGLSKLSKGRYSAVLTSGNEQFTYNIEIK